MTTVLVSGVGALIGQGILNSLNKYRAEMGLNIIGVDLNGLTHARYLCAEFIQKPAVDENSAQYMYFWRDMLTKYHVDIILPGIENDVVFLNRSECKALGFPSLINSSKTLSIGLDKYSLSIFSAKHNILSIPTALASDNEFTRKLIETSGKSIAKPRQSNGSRGIYRFSSGNELSSFIQEISPDELDNFIIQPQLGSDSEEYTASIFGFGGGQYQGPIVFRRLLAKDGYTKYVHTVTPPSDILHSISKISTICNPIGPTNFQYRASNGRYYLMEINPRFSSTTSLKAAFGFDETRMSLDFFLNGTKHFTGEMRHGEAWRYISDFVRFS